MHLDLEVRNATSANNKIMQNMCTTLNNQIWVMDYITG